MEIYHGSKLIIQKPKIISNGNYKDFGFGFYCTNNQKQAEKWAKTKSEQHPVVSIFDFEYKEGLNVKKFDSVNSEWLNFIANCRAGSSHEYDIVEGPMADDTIWNFVQLYLNKQIPESAFLEIAKFKYPTHQITFCTEKALECLKFKRSYDL